MPRSLVVVDEVYDPGGREVIFKRPNQVELAQAFTDSRKYAGPVIAVPSSRLFRALPHKHLGSLKSSGQRLLQKSVFHTLLTTLMG